MNSSIMNVMCSETESGNQRKKENLKQQRKRIRNKNPENISEEENNVKILVVE